jgi:hypothetical protein
VAATELVGIWRIDAASQKDLRDSGYKVTAERQYSVQLSSSGECHFATFLIAFDANGRAIEPLDVGCHWTLGDLGHQALLIDLAEPVGVHAHYYFGETANGQLTFWQYVGDPDEWRYIQYVKMPS